METDTSQRETREEKYLDFQITSKIIRLCEITDQLANTQVRVGEDLERALLQFALIYKTYILTDSRVMTVGKQIAEGFKESRSEPQPQPSKTVQDFQNFMKIF